MKSRRRWLGIRGKFLLLVGFVVVFVTLFTTVLSVRSQRDALLGERRLRGLSVLRSWSSLCRERLLSDESVNLAMWDFIDDMKGQESSVEEVYLLDTNGVVVLHDDPKRVGTRAPAALLAHLRGVDSTSIAEEDDSAGTRLRFERTISASGKRLGYSVVAFSSKGIEQGIRESVLLIVAASGVAGLVGLLFAWVLVVQISRPIRLLMEGVRRFGETFDPHRPETADFRIEFVASNEIGDIRDSFNEMTSELSRNLLDRQRLLEETGVLRVQATTDAMTGLLNKRQFQEEYPAVLRLAVKKGKPVCLMMLDMDRFKQLNDTMGHAAGDKALIDLADAVRSQTRSSERAYRIGGDEFVVIAAGADLDGGRSIAGRIARDYDARKAPGNPTTISFGIAVYDGKSTPEEFLHLADEEMYRVKREKKAQR